LAEQQKYHLGDRLKEAEAALQTLTPEPGRGKRQYRDELSLQAAISGVLKYNVTGLLHVSYQRQEKIVTRYVGRGRGGANRQQRREVHVRYSITGVERDEVAIQNYIHRLGWRVYATSLPSDVMSLSGAVIHYRGGWSLERDFINH
jgi:transposase